MKFVTRFLVMATFILGVSAYATETVSPMECTGPQTVYDKIKALYVEGTLPQFTPYLEKLTSGRCFLKKDPNAPIAAYFAPNEKNDLGPIDPTPQYEGAIQYNHNLEPGYFDDSKVTLSNNHVAAWRVRLILSDDRTYVMNYESKEKLFVRSSGSFLVAIATADDQETAVCYFFKTH